VKQPVQLDVSRVQAHLRQFAAERDWEQFHNPKNLVMALAGEVGELTEIFQWLTPEQSATVMRDPRRATCVEHELADILQYVIRLSDLLEIDLDRALWNKLRRNAEQYPVALARGNARKYTELGEEKTAPESS